MKIDKNIPIPITLNKYRKNWKDTAAKMEDGDSILVDNHSQATGLRMAICQAFPDSAGVARSDGGGYRVWRVKRGL